MRKLIIPVIMIILLAIACNQGTVSSTGKNAANGNVIDLPSAKSFIDNINMKFNEQVLNGDFVTLASHYRADGEICHRLNSRVRYAVISYHFRQIMCS